MGHVIEVMRPLPLEGIVDAPQFVLGMSIVRGAVIPVLDAGCLLSGRTCSPSRMVTLRVGARCVALAVDDVHGAVPIGENVLREVPPLLSGSSPTLSAIGTLDAKLLVVLETARLLPESVLAAISGAAETP
jgi:purine-binding chemotaxis protein CheW